MRGFLLLVVQMCPWGSQITDKKIIKNLCGHYHILTKIGNCGNDLNTGGVKIERQKIVAINKLVRFLVDTMPSLNIGGGVEGSPRSFKLQYKMTLWNVRSLTLQWGGRVLIKCEEGENIFFSVSIILRNLVFLIFFFFFWYFYYVSWASTWTLLLQEVFCFALCYQFCLINFSFWNV